MISEETATARGAECASKVSVFFEAAARGQKVDGIVSGMDETYCVGSSTDVPSLARFRILRSTFNVRCLGPVGGFEKLWTARPWPVEHVGGRGRQETAAGEGPLGALSMSINARSGATVGQLPWFQARCSALRKRVGILIRGAGVSPLPKFSKDPSLQAESSDPESSLSYARYLVADSAVIKGSAVM